jgi:hypothetical protein
MVAVHLTMINLAKIHSSDINFYLKTFKLNTQNHGPAISFIFLRAILRTCLCFICFN